MKKKLIIFGTILVMILLSVGYIVKADSGWDSNYDSNWSSSSSRDSNWGSSSSSRNNDRDYRSHSSSSSSRKSLSSYSSYGDDIIQLVEIFWGIIIFVIFISSISAPRRKQNLYTTARINDYTVQGITQEELNKYFPGENLQEFKDKLFSTFVEVQEAWMNFDYDKLKEICSDTLYNSYKADLEALKLKNGQNIMKNFNVLKHSIIRITNVNGIITVTDNLVVTFIDYVVDTKTGIIKRGQNQTPLRNSYILEFIVSSDKNDNKCQGCGAPLENNVSGVCSYCRSKYVIKPNKIVLSTKRRD